MTNGGGDVEMCTAPECDLMRTCGKHARECVVSVDMPANTLYRVYVYGATSSDVAGDAVSLEWRPPRHCGKAVQVEHIRLTLG